MDLLDAIILGIIEGLTEFLPISSTGHMILASAILKLQNPEFLKTFEISIQLGAIFAIVLLYAGQLLSNLRLYKKLILAFLPTAVIGLLFYKIIKTYLFNPIVVSIALIVGGILIILLDKRITSDKSKLEKLENMSNRGAFMIGLCQSMAVIPGVSRAAATIIGGVFNGLDKKQATEFSFLLAIPTMLAATGYDLLKTPASLAKQEFILIGLGSVASFVFAWIAVKLFLKFIERHGFTFFGYYRIILGVISLWYFL